MNREWYACLGLAAIAIWGVVCTARDDARIRVLEKENRLLRIERIVENGYSPSNYDKKELDINGDGQITYDDYYSLMEAK